MSNDIDDRLSRRFSSDSEEKSDEQSQTERTSSESRAERSSSESQNAQTPRKAQNIKKEWNVRSIYLSDGLNSDLSMAFKRLDLQLSEANAELSLKKTRHFYPLIVELGLERLESMEVSEVTDRLEE